MNYERATLEFWGFDLSGLTDDEIRDLYVKESVRRWSAVADAAKQSGAAFESLAQSLARFSARPS